MTNTRDYRQYTPMGEGARLINSFDFQRGAQAPRIRPDVQPEQERELKVRENGGVKSREQLVHEQKHSRARVIRIAFVAVFCLLMVGAVLNSFALKNQLTRDISKMETNIANAQSEYISLESRLNSLVSISMIDQYAVEELGMTKVRSNQIQYMDVSEFKQAREAALAEEGEDSAEQDAEENSEDSTEDSTEESTEDDAADETSGEEQVINN